MTATPITVGARISHWRIIAVDAVGKRATVQCCTCSAVRLVAVVDLADAPCSCRPLSVKQRQAINQAEQQLHTRREFDWRPGR
jgi:hypothetical protein